MTTKCNRPIAAGIKGVLMACIKKNMVFSVFDMENSLNLKEMIVLYHVFQDYSWLFKDISCLFFFEFHAFSWFLRFLLEFMVL